MKRYNTIYLLFFILIKTTIIEIHRSYRIVSLNIYKSYYNVNSYKYLNLENLKSKYISEDIDDHIHNSISLNTKIQSITNVNNINTNKPLLNGSSLNEYKEQLRQHNTNKFFQLFTTYQNTNNTISLELSYLLTRILSSMDRVVLLLFCDEIILSSLDHIIYLDNQSLTALMSALIR